MHEKEGGEREGEGNFSERNARIVRIMELDELTVQRQRQSDGMAMAEYSGYWIGRARLNLYRRDTYKSHVT